jgi:thiazole synthase
LQLYQKKITCPLLLGTARYPSIEVLKESILCSQTEVVTLSLRRQSPESDSQLFFWETLKKMNLNFLPNTAGARTVKEAILTAHLAREFFNTPWIKLEVIGDEDSLSPDCFSLVEAAGILLREGFHVFPYMNDDIVVADRLANLGCKVLMPWASPIGSGQGILHESSLQMIRNRFPELTLIVDAGIGRPSHAAHAMELGYDGVLLNTAVALAKDPAKMASAFTKAIQAGREGYLSGLMSKRDTASASTPLIGTPFWHL